MKLQTVNIEGVPCAIVPLKDYDALQEALEEAADAEALRLDRTEEAIPMSMADRLYRENAVKVWRVHRGMTATELATAADISNSQLSAIESGDSSGSVATLQRIAKALEVTMDDLLGGTKLADHAGGAR